MTRNEVKEILNRVLDWPADDQEKLVRFVFELERWYEDRVIIDEARQQLNEGSLSPSR
jgi:hypothetical protein